MLKDTFFVFPFQSTPFMRWETVTVNPYCIDQSISIHSPHVRGDTSSMEVCRIGFQFQSTPLMRGETGG